MSHQSRFIEQGKATYLGRVQEDLGQLLDSTQTLLDGVLLQQS